MSMPTSVAGMVPGALSLFLADHMSWQAVF